MPIDTHQGYKQLLEAGVPEPQAEATVALFTQWAHEELVTKEYLDLRLTEFQSENQETFTRSEAKNQKQSAEFEARIERQFAESEANFQRQFAEFEAKIQRHFAEFKAEIRQEFDEFKAEIRQEFDEFKLEIRQELAEREKRLLRWMFTLVGVATGLLGTLMTVLRFIDV